MRHPVTTVALLRQAKAAAEDEAAAAEQAADRPEPKPKPRPRTRPATGRMAMTARTLARRARAIAARAT
jgi:hypothetical protein